MKCLTVITHESAKQDLIDLFREIPEVTAYTFIQGEGHSSGPEQVSFATDRDRVLGYVPRVRVDLILSEELIEVVMSRLKGCETCVRGPGVWWVTPVDHQGHL